MAKPFKLTTQAAIGRGEGGRFERLVSAAPPEVIRRTYEDGIELNQAIREAAVPDRLVGKGEPENVAGPGSRAKAPVYPDAIPWPKAGPVNDADKKPFKL